MPADFNGKVVLVTGAGTGIGRAVARRFAADGAHVVIIGRTEDTLREAASTSERISYPRERRVWLPSSGRPGKVRVRRPDTRPRSSGY